MHLPVFECKSALFSLIIGCISFIHRENCMDALAVVVYWRCQPFEIVALWSNWCQARMIVRELFDSFNSIIQFMSKHLWHSSQYGLLINISVDSANLPTNSASLVQTKLVKFYQICYVFTTFRTQASSRDWAKLNRIPPIVE